jgi:hypothetical protein
MSWHKTELGNDEGNIQFPTMADACMSYKAPIEPKDVVAIVIISSASEARTRREVVGLLSS